MSKKKKINVSEATNAELDWLVFLCEEKVLKQPELGLLRHQAGYGKFRPTTDWSQMGPIIEREKIDIEHTNWLPTCVYAKYLDDETGQSRQYGDSLLIAAARCYVASKLGEEVEVPEELV